MKSLDVDGYQYMRFADPDLHDAFNNWLIDQGMQGPTYVREMVFGEGFVHVDCRTTIHERYWAWLTVPIATPPPAGVYVYLNERSEPLPAFIPTAVPK